MHSQKKLSWLFVILLLFTVIVDKKAIAKLLEGPPFCTKNFKNGHGVIYWGGGNTSTYDECSSTLEPAEASIYKFMDWLPCSGESCIVDCWPGNYLPPCGTNYHYYRHSLAVSGDIGKDKFVIMTNGGKSYYIPGTYNSGDVTRIWIGCPSANIEDGKVSFTYIVKAIENQSNPCTGLFDTVTGQINPNDCNCKQAIKPLFKIKGSFIIKKNPREDINIFNLFFSPDNAISGQSSFSPERYDKDDFPFTRYVNDGYWNGMTCSCDENINPHYWFLSEDRTDYRVKVPGWNLDVGVNESYGLPSYMYSEGWNTDIDQQLLWLNLGSFGKVYFHHNIPSDSSAYPGSYCLDSIEFCDIGEQPGQGDIQWRFNYEEDENEKKHLRYIYNGTDPNCPEQSEKYYKLIWNDDYDTLQQEYYHPSIGQNALRVWNVSFDDQGRVIESIAGCSSGCGGSTYGYEKVDYCDEFEGYNDLIKNRYNSNGDIIEKNGYKIFQYGDSWEYESRVLNASFEAPDVTYGYFQEGSPVLWNQTNDPNFYYVRVYEPNEIQWSSRYNMGEAVPDGSQILTLLGGKIQQKLNDLGIQTDTTYVLEADTGAFIDPNSSDIKITWIAYDPESSDPQTDEVLAEINVDENSEPNGFGTQLDEGKWVTQAAVWDSFNNPEMTDRIFKLVIEGNYVDVDNISIYAVTFLGAETKPLLVHRMAEPASSSEPNLLFETWDYNCDDYTAIERRWVDNESARITKYQYADEAFSRLISKTEYENLNEDPDDPVGFNYTTYYVIGSEYDPNDSVYSTIYPSGKRKDVEIRENGLTVESYIEDVENGAKTNIECFSYAGDLLRKHTDARGGITEYSYSDDLLVQQTDPETDAGQRITTYQYDGARRMISEAHQDSEGTWIRTNYNYNETTGFLDTMIVDDDYGQHTGKKIITQYFYNDFGQVVREISPDGIITGKSYGLGGELTSDFILTSDCDPNVGDENLTLISQTWYLYDDDGRIEYIKKVKSDEPFLYANPQDPNDSLQWITTQYEYDFLGRKTAVIEDTDGLRLKTQYEYNNQGEVKKVTLPNGKWTETYRDGRGLMVMQIIGHDDLDSKQWQVTEFEYDANGNLTKQTSPDDTSAIYQYDNFDRLVKVKRGITD